MRTGATIFICESQPVIVEGLIRILEDSADLKFAGYAEEITCAIKEVLSQPPDIFLIGQPPGVRFILPFITQVREARVTSQVVLWVNEMSQMDAFGALLMGVRGFATRVQPTASILECLRTVASGAIFIAPPIKLDNHRRVALHLTRRERQIVEAVSKGMKNRQIADALSITEGTVKVHLTHIFEKTGATNRFELASRSPHPFPSAR